MRMGSDNVPGAGSIGPVTSRRIPGREDVPEEPKAPEKSAIDDTKELTLEDIELVTVLLDACAQRGAFKASEFSIVGKLHDKLEAFVASHRG
jgi:hypothetical protein